MNILNGNMVVSVKNIILFDRMIQFRLPINKNIVISNKDTFWKKLIQMKKDGKQFLQVRSI